MRTGVQSTGVLVIFEQQKVMIGPVSSTEMMATATDDGALSPFGSANPRAAAASDDGVTGRSRSRGRPRRRRDDDAGRRCPTSTRGRIHGGGSASSLPSLISSSSWTTLLLLQLLLLLGTCTCGVDAGGSRRLRINNNANSRSIGVMNDSGVKIDVFWVNPETKALAESAVGSGIMFGGSSGINSYVGHTFEVQEMPTKKSGCLGPNKQCRKTYFTVSGDEDQVFTIEKDFTVTIENHRTKALKIAQDAINGCTPPDASSSSLSALEQLDAYANCLSAQLNRTLEAKKEEIEFEKSVRKKMADKMVLYACDDPKLATTKATRNSTWTYRDESIAATSSGSGNTAKRIRDVPHRVQVLFESDASTILLVKDFYSAEQCQQLMDVSVDAVSPAESVQVRHRNVPLSAKSKVGPLLAKMYQLVLGYVQTGVEYTHDPMLVLQFHSGTASTAKGQEECVVSESGESTGACASASTASNNATTRGTLHKVDDKALAQLRIVCRTSDDLVGGAIHYPKAGVHINPALDELSAGYAVLTVYHDPKTGDKEVDPFVEEHVECPVQRGELVSIVQYFVGPTE